MSSDDKPKKNDAFDALDAFAAGEDPAEPQPTQPAPAPQQPAAPKPATPPPPPPPRKKRAAAPPPRPTQPVEQEPLIPTVDGRSPRPEMPPAVPKAAKPTPAKPVGAAPGKATPTQATPVKAKAVAAAPAPAKPTRRKGGMDRKRLARINQQMNFRQTLIPILITLGVIVFALGIMGLMMLPDKTVDPDDQDYDPDNWDDLDPNSPLNKPVTKVAVYLTFPLGLLLWVGAGVLMVQVFGFKAKIRAAEAAAAEQEEAA